MTLRFHPEAASELEAALGWYEAERPGLGAELLAEIGRRVAQATRFPASGAPVAGVAPRYDVRGFGVRRFPFVMFTALVGSERIVVAVAHSHREPSYWRDRLG